MKPARFARVFSNFYSLLSSSLLLRCFHRNGLTTRTDP
jgi:hypothetical protein